MKEKKDKTVNLFGSKRKNKKVNKKIKEAQDKAVKGERVVSTHDVDRINDFIEREPNFLDKAFEQAIKLSGQNISKKDLERTFNQILSKDSEAKSYSDKDVRGDTADEKPVIDEEDGWN